MASSQSVGLFGGTFDPVHIGHLRVALELNRLLGLAQMRLVPCANPSHRGAPLSSSKDRLRMLELAIADVPELWIDDCELKRAGPSYSVDTLATVRGEIGDSAPLFFCVGMDCLVSLDSWRRWRELLDYANLVVAARPGWVKPEQGDIAGWLAEHQSDSLDAVKKARSGRVYIARMTLLPVSSTRIRGELEKGIAPQFLVPDPVIEYINRQQLYLRRKGDE